MDSAIYEYRYIFLKGCCIETLVLDQIEFIFKINIYFHVFDLHNALH